MAQHVTKDSGYNPYAKYERQWQREAMVARVDAWQAQAIEKAPRQRTEDDLPPLRVRSPRRVKNDRT